MDLVKIGSYIAEKRKALGLTQKQLAEKLNMSDKSVSKWERGICLPDVSIYMELCSILRISINEFLAGAKTIFRRNCASKRDYSKCGFCERKTVYRRWTNAADRADSSKSGTGECKSG